MNSFDPFDELLAHAGLLRQHDRFIKSLLTHDSQSKREFLGLQQQVIRLLDHIQEQEERISRLEELIDSLIIEDDTE
jgi:hypothetical protein